MNNNQFSFEWPNYNWHLEMSKEKRYKNTTISFSPQRRITNREIKKNDTFFNPITQRYSKDDHIIRQSEAKSIPRKIASYYDRSLRYEQTFNIISLKDKFRLFKNHPDYPTEKEPFGNKTLKDMSKIEYNILSNVNLKDHHFERPEKRPDKPSTSPKIKQSMKQVWTFKDYDIISNKYNNDDSAKSGVNEKAFKLEAASKYWRTHNFNPLTGKYFDDEKEKTYQLAMKEKEKIHGAKQTLKLPKRVQEQGLLYNPVNMKILDKERLINHEERLRNKIKRYEQKNQIDEFFLKRDMALTERAEIRKSNKKCYEYYREQDNRGFNIVNNSDQPKYKTSLKLKDHKNDWDVLKEGSINKINKVFKEEYDYSDAQTNYDEFKGNRISKFLI